MRGRSEVKNVGIANVQVKDFMSLLLDLIGQANQVADGVTQVVQALGWSDFADLG